MTRREIALLSGADIVLRRDPAGGWQAVVIVGSYSSTAVDDDPAQAIGRAVMKQADMTEKKLTKELGSTI